MKRFRLFATFALAAALPIAVGNFLHADDALPAKPGDKQPVNVCIVSGEHLQPGDIVTYVYQQDGKPDRTLRFCCRKCLARFKTNPELYLKKLDRLESGKKENNQAEGAQ